MEYHSAMIRSEMLTRAMTWINCKIIMLSKRSEMKKSTCHLVPFTNSRKHKHLKRQKAYEYLQGRRGGGMDIERCGRQDSKKQEKVDGVMVTCIVITTVIR
jgi:hypothetical protein